jgi:hypothetical protein
MALNATDSSASVFSGSCLRLLPSISQLEYTLSGYSFLTQAIPHAFMSQGLYFLTADTRLYCSPNDLLARAHNILSQTDM